MTFIFFAEHSKNFIPWYAYRISKTSQNMSTLMMSKELISNNIVSIAIDPGVVESKITEPFKKFLPSRLSSDASAEKITKCIENIKPEDNGKFYALSGQEIPF